VVERRRVARLRAVFFLTRGAPPPRADARGPSPARVSRTGRHRTKSLFNTTARASEALTGWRRSVLDTPEATARGRLRVGVGPHASEKCRAKRRRSTTRLGSQIAASIGNGQNAYV